MRKWWYNIILTPRPRYGEKSQPAKYGNNEDERERPIYPFQLNDNEGARKITPRPRFEMQATETKQNDAIKFPDGATLEITRTKDIYPKLAACDSATRDYKLPIKWRSNNTRKKTWYCNARNKKYDAEKSIVTYNSLKRQHYLGRK